MTESTPPGPPPAGLYNARLLQVCLELLAARYPAVSVHELLRDAQIAPHEAADPGHWLTQDQINAFYQRAAALSGNPGLAFEAGRFAASSHAFGRLRQWVLSHVGLAQGYALLGRSADRLTRASHFTTRGLGPGAVELVSVRHAGVEEQPFQCEARTGLLLALALFFNTEPQLEHPECAFRGDPNCRYVLRWRPTRSERWRQRSAPVALALSGVAVGLAFWLPTAALPALVLSGALALGALHHFVARLEVADLRALVGRIRAGADRTLEVVGEEYESARLVHDIGLAVSRQTDPKLTSAPAGGAEGPERDHDPGQVLTSAMRVLERHLDYERGLVLLYDPGTASLVCRASHGFAPELRAELDALAVAIDDDADVFAACFADQRPQRADVAPAEGDPDPRALAIARRLGARSFVLCPITYEQRPLGVLYVDRTATGRPLLQRDLNILTGIAPTLAVSVHSALLATAMTAAEHAAATDSLTGLQNRRGLELRLAERWAARDARPGGFAVIFIDIDYFKAVNDTFGHAVGDAVLVELAAELGRLHRGGDVVGRWGGEEFLVLLAEADGPAAASAAERVRAALGAYPFEALLGGNLTVSIGGAVAAPGDAGPMDVLARADGAMYEAKEAGRDRAVMRAAPAASRAGQWLPERPAK